MLVMHAMDSIAAGTSRMLYAMGYMTWEYLAHTERLHTICPYGGEVAHGCDVCLRLIRSACVCRHTRLQTVFVA
jgi:hypothetical protein